MKTPVDVATLARYILSSDCKSIAILTGAGVSVASGIPDFRSPGGMYDTLRPELITASDRERELMSLDPTYVVSWDIFSQNSLPYLEVRKPFIIGTSRKEWKATIAHRFFELLHVKTKKLKRIYTQNIDGLDFQCTKIPTENIVSVHGTIAEAACEGCGKDVSDYTKFCNNVQTNIKDIYNMDPNAPIESTPIVCEHCSKPLVKPKTVLFGRNLPSRFFQCCEQDIHRLDLLIVAGTSLVVSPANSLVYNVPDHTIRVIINQEEVGTELGIDYSEDDYNPKKRDCFIQGNCDEIFLELIEHLGWLPDIQQMNMDDLPESSTRLLSRKAYTSWF